MRSLWLGYAACMANVAALNINAAAHVAMNDPEDFAAAGELRKAARAGMDDRERLALAIIDAQKRGGR